ncbi:MAG: peptidoglycan editing factor PgeF [Bacteroidaceae bacterium]|nr:peptidoglycan editing factor PgeF [Bacteroidaceae bacterium]
MGGVSKGSYSSFNVCHYVEDNPQHVAHNRQLLAGALGLATNQIVFPRQTHSTNILLCDSTTSSSQLEGVDALITKQRGLCIGVNTADCIPILLYDPVNHAAAAIHAGWRGTVGHIAYLTVHAMQKHFGSDLRQVRAFIGPGISCKAFEVGDELPEIFVQAGFSLNEIACRINDRWHIDLPLANSLDLKAAGIPLENITCSNLCTFFGHERFFSARRLGIHSGRIYTGIVIHPVAS